MKIDDEKVLQYLEAIRRLSPKPETTARDLERARRTVRQQASVRPARRSGIHGALRRSTVARIAAVLCVAGLIALILLDGGIEIDGAKAALAQVLQALEEAPIMHKVLNTSYEGPEAHQTEDWYDFRSRTVVSKYFTDGRCRKISSLNYGTKEHVLYDPETDVVTISYYIDVGPTGAADSAADVVTEYLKNYKFWGAEIERERSRYEGVEVDVYHLRIEPTERREKQYAALIVNAQTNLPMAISKEVRNSQGVVKFSQGITFDFPSVGPKDIYDLGVPRSARIVVDAASKERNDRRLVLESRIPQLQEEFQHAQEDAYRPSEGQVLVWVPPALAQPRVELEQAKLEIDKLVHEQEDARIAQTRPTATRKPWGGVTPEDLQRPRYAVFTYDKSEEGADRYKESRVFRDGAMVKDALEWVVGFSRFEYDLPQEIGEVNIPGDWVVRRDSSKEQRMAAFEKIVQGRPGRAIVFRASRVEREVVVARGTFHFQPQAGTYNPRWIHVYADQLDPDTRGGGGSGSLAKFVRYLGEVAFNQQVIDETRSEPDVDVHYGWHMSGYIRNITDEKERAIKLRMVLDNVSRQTGLEFTVERRWITVWLITGDRPHE
jgi:hypothetical protein